MATKVIDISYAQKNVDFAKVKAAGIDGVIIRAGVTGWGSAHSMEKDAQFENHYKGAKAAGLHVGCYYFSGALSEEFAVKEANFFLSIIKGKAFDLPVYVDIEEEHSTTNMPALGKTKLTNVVYRWCETVEKAGYFTGFYTAKSWATSYLDMQKLSRFTFWLAHYTSKTSYSGAYAMWQYSDAGTVPGISGKVDMDLCYQDFPPVITTAGLNGYPKPDDGRRYTLTITPLTKANADRLVKVLADINFYGKVTEVQ